MAVDTYIEQARTRVRAEQEATDAKLDALDEFVRRVEDISTEPTPATSTAITTVAEPQQHANSASDARCRQIRQAFAETVRPHSVDDLDDAESESLLETIRAEFTEPLALALAPTADASFSPELRQMVISEAAARRAETVALDKALAREAAHLSDTSDVMDDITGWIVDANETVLAPLGFDALEDRHETLADYRTRCQQLARQRQAFLEKTTSNGVEAGVSHRQLIPYLYREFPVDHPVLATLDATCDECQRTVRYHLVRRA